MLNMVKHKTWATTIVARKSVGSMTTKGQMKSTCRVSSTVSQARGNSQTNVPEHTIVSTIQYSQQSSCAENPWMNSSLLHVLQRRVQKSPG